MKMTLKKMFAVALSLVLVFGLVACGDAPADDADAVDTADGVVGDITPETIKENGELVLVTDANYAPFVSHKEIDGEDQIVGLDVDIGQYIADDLGVELVIQDVDFDAALQTIASGMADISIGGINPDPVRAETMDFTDIYLESEYVVLVKEENAGLFTGPEEMAENNAVIGTQTGSTQEKLAMELDGVEVISITELPDMIVQLQGGHVDALILENSVGDLYAAANDDLIAEHGGDFENINSGAAIAVPKDNPELVEYLNGLIAEMLESGYIEDSYDAAIELAAE